MSCVNKDLKDTKRLPIMKHETIDSAVALFWEKKKKIVKASLKRVLSELR